MGNLGRKPSYEGNGEDAYLDITVTYWRDGCSGSLGEVGRGGRRGKRRMKRRVRRRRRGRRRRRKRMRTRKRTRRRKPLG